MDACQQNISEFLSRDIGQWSGLATGCRKEDLAGWLPFSEGAGKAFFGTKNVDYAFRALIHEGFIGTMRRNIIIRSSSGSFEKPTDEPEDAANACTSDTTSRLMLVGSRGGTPAACPRAEARGPAERDGWLAASARHRAMTRCRPRPGPFAARGRYPRFSRHRSAQGRLLMNRHFGAE